MALSAFSDRDRQPAPDDIAATLGRAAPQWAALVEHVRATVPAAVEEWTHPGAKYGWSMRLVAGKRRLIYLTPQSGEFLIGLVLGEKAIGRAREAGMAPEVAAIVDAAPKYPEGRGIQVAVRTARDLRLARLLFALKLA